MKIVIIGSGEIGFHLSKLLSVEQHDVTVLDHDEKALEILNEACDVLTVKGEATSIEVLLAAGVDKADLIVAATDVDEINMVASLISKRLGAARVIARVRNDELCRPESPLTPSDMGIDVLIHPEHHVALEIVRLIKRASASELVGIADDRLQLIGNRLDSDSPLIKMTLEEFAHNYSSLPFRVVAIIRNGRTLIPFGNNKFNNNDQIFILAEPQNVSRVIAATGRIEKKINSIMIAGCTALGSRITKNLSVENSGWRIKLIESDIERARNCATLFKNVLVIHGDPTDIDLLVSEGVQDTDAFVSVTSDEESNIISCLMAKHLGVKKSIALVSKAEYIPLSQSIGLDSAVNKKLSVTNEIHRQIRQGRVVSNYSPYGSNAEIVELVVADKSKAAGKKISELTLPKTTIIGAVIHGDSVEIATGTTIINAGGHVILFCHPDDLNRVTSYFS